MSPLWTSAEAAAATGGKATRDFAITGISIDTRTLAKGDLFVALQGDARDGHQFVAQAQAKGAGAALVSQRPGDVAADAPLLVVGDTLEALRGLGRAARARTGARVGAITGSVGKTSTKEALRHVLAAQGKTHAADASYNNHWGVPLTLARMPQDSAYAAIEIGMNHAGEIAPLTALARPHAAIVTTVEAVHLEHFPNVESIADEKGAIFSGLEAGGAAVLNRDNPQYQRLRGHAERSRAGAIWSFGEHAEADARLVDVKLLPDSSQVHATLFGEALSYTYGAPGRHLVMNSLGVLLMAKAMGADARAAADSFADMRALKGRGARQSVSVPGGAFTLIDESYNANPASMRAAFALLAQTPVEKGGRRIAIVGDMLELGPDAGRMHAGLAGDLRATGTDLVFACGPLMAQLWDALPQAMRGAYAATSADLATLCAAEAKAGDAIMIKGSFGSRMGLIVEALKAGR